MRHEKYEQYEKYRVRIPLKWGGEYPGHSKAILNAISFRDGQEALLKNTLGFITGHIQTLYEETLEAMLPKMGVNSSLTMTGCCSGGWKYGEWIYNYANPFWSKSSCEFLDP